MSEYILDSGIQFLPGVGPKRAEMLGKELGITTIKDLIYTFPFRYVDRSRFYAVSEITDCNAYVQMRGTVRNKTISGTGSKMRLVVLFSDGTGNIELVFFKGIKWTDQKINVGSEYIVFGKPSQFNDRINFVHPEIEPVSSAAAGTRMPMTGVYSSTEKLTSYGITNKVFVGMQQKALSMVSGRIAETLPDWFLRGKHLMPLSAALFNIHFPADLQSLEKARERLKYEELFYLQLSLVKQKYIKMREAQGILLPRIGDAFNYTYSHLPFPLTGAQKRVLKEIRADMTGGKQMNRLLQGDVGSGKTLVAILTALQAVDNGYQARIMAPTEVLANQHYNGVFKFIDPGKVKVALLTGNTKTKERREILAGLADGTVDIVFGTHALLEDRVQFANLAVAVIDEQHRFGVDQRSKLWSKSEIAPHILVMTATPIPRTLAMTLYGDLDVSVIDELPPGRKPIVTTHVGENQRKKVYDFMRREIDAGRQVFVVYPLIKESEKMDYENLEQGYLNITEEFKPPQYITAVVHGKQTPENKAFDMDLFARGKAHILVATSVIEVGVDVPNASVMVIESAERFGLSQLHQLRGRVGRGAEKSYCILMTSYKLSAESRERLDLMCRTNDGLELAEADLKMRGPGDFEGTRQSGMSIDLHIANLTKDSPMLEDARRTAQDILMDDPTLSSPRNALLAKNLKEIRNEIKDYSKIS
ncbi:MAG: ATP-dependent DNA helicase RecG [Bacteroidales bacterium]|nr:ATP-dependent DNA helicase RecG [Candidatus Equibacterium intestinale]